MHNILDEPDGKCIKAKSASRESRLVSVIGISFCSSFDFVKSKNLHWVVGGRYGSRPRVRGSNRRTARLDLTSGTLHHYNMLWIRIIHLLAGFDANPFVYKKNSNWTKHPSTTIGTIRALVSIVCSILPNGQSILIRMHFRGHESVEHIGFAGTMYHCDLCVIPTHRQWIDRDPRPAPKLSTRILCRPSAIEFWRNGHVRIWEQRTSCLAQCANVDGKGSTISWRALTSASNDDSSTNTDFILIMWLNYNASHGISYPVKAWAAQLGGPLPYRRNNVFGWCPSVGVWEPFESARAGPPLIETVDCYVDRQRSHPLACCTGFASKESIWWFGLFWNCN